MYHAMPKALLESKAKHGLAEISKRLYEPGTLVACAGVMYNLSKSAPNGKLY